MRFLLQGIHSMTRRIIFKIIIENYFCTKIKFLLFDLMRIIFFNEFKWGVFFYLHYKLKVKENIRFLTFI